MDTAIRTPRKVKRAGQLLFAFIGAFLLALAVSACAPIEETASNEPWAAPLAPTDAIAPTLQPAGDLPTADLEPAATALPPATVLPVSRETVVQTVPDAEAAAARTRYQRLLRAEWDTDFTRTTISFDEIMTGGPPKDGIPSIDDPQFESITDADRWLDDLEPVQVVDINGDVRAYPVQVMVWHELVNDTVGGEPVVITF